MHTHTYQIPLNDLMEWGIYCLKPEFKFIVDYITTTVEGYDQWYIDEAKVGH